MEEMGAIIASSVPDINKDQAICDAVGIYSFSCIFGVVIYYKANNTKNVNSHVRSKLTELHKVLYIEVAIPEKA